MPAPANSLYLIKGLLDGTEHARYTDLMFKKAKEV